MNSENPLIKAYRKPSVYVTLPSGGKYYNPPVQLSVDGELAVYAMTARDELVSKTPDALFNGEATVSLIKSCCPDIPDARQVPVSDLVVLLLGIRLASYGNDIDLDINCPSCNGFNQLKADGGRLLGTVKPIEVDPIVKLDSGMRVHVKPFTLEDRTNLQIQQIKQQKMVEGLVARKDMPEEEREVVFGKMFVEIAEITVNVITNSIAKVVTDDDTVVDDDALIQEWLQSISKADYDAIRARIEDMSKDNIDNKFHAKCVHCGTEWDTRVDLDMANFLGG